ncbi:MAG TPA: hypothetical protein VND45_04240 [Thermoanaerobaculia bacterium]|nr:hypothetical protein [Thermoanaerobaculia bacterium]
MKSRSVAIDADLLDKTRRATGEKTYAAAVRKVLEEYARKNDFWTAYTEWADEARKGGMFTPGYLEELRPPERAVFKAPKRRISAHEKRAAPVKSVRRGSR